MLASGRPVIATALPWTQVAKLVVQCGLVVQPGDAGALVDAVLSLADDTPRRAELGARARAYAEGNLGRDAILSRFESELRSLITS
jgi:colanic acid biosynthesis glycosyl transferase WcaI